MGEIDNNTVRVDKTLTVYVYHYNNDYLFFYPFRIGVMDMDYINRPKLYTSSYVAERIVEKITEYEHAYEEGIQEHFFTLWLQDKNDPTNLTRLNGQRRCLSTSSGVTELTALDTEAVTNQLIALGKGGVGTVLVLDYSGENLLPVAVREHDGWEVLPVGKHFTTLRPPVKEEYLFHIYPTLKQLHKGNHHEKKAG